MKTILFFLGLILLTISMTLKAGEVTGAGKIVRDVLREHQVDLAALERQGHRLLVGENTGAGLRAQMENVRFFVTGKYPYQMQNVTHVLFKVGSPAKTFDDIEQLEIGTAVVKGAEVKGLIIKVP